MNDLRRVVPEIIRHQSAFVVADVTDERPNVREIGLARRGQGSVLVAKQGTNCRYQRRAGDF
jgi:hypothetical protein